MDPTSAQKAASDPVSTAGSSSTASSSTASSSTAASVDVRDDAGQRPVLDVRDLTVRFRTRGRSRSFVHAVSSASFTIAPGETLGLIGESGSGKSTVARAVSQLLVRDRALVTGEMRLGDTRLDQLSKRELRSHRHRMQMIFQDPNDALDPRMTVRQSIEEPLRILRRLSAQDLAKEAEASLEAVGLPVAMGERRPHELSGGQRQRVNVARAISLEPELVLCDEVVSALDVSIQADILALLARLQRERGIAYLFISHDLGVVASVSDRIGVMYLGRIVEVGTTEQIVTDPQHPYTEALLSAEPEALPRHLRLRNRIILEGDVPSPMNPPSGCGLRTRCRYVQDLCAREVPPLRARDDGHLVACHFADELVLAGRRTAGSTGAGAGPSAGATNP